MPFHEVSRMEQRKRMVYRVEHEGVSVTEAARQAGVSRATFYTWQSRARQEGLVGLEEASRRPHHSPGATADELVQQVLACKERYPAWGGKKISAWLWPQPGEAPVTVRTVDRILLRHGLTRTRTASPLAMPALQRFERARSNELWQMDFKGMGRPRHCYAPLSILDDHSRYVFRFEPLEQQTQEAVWRELWGLFGEVGLPDQFLTDNGSCFAGTWGEGPTQLETRLWLLGIQTTQGRPYHPQTQGKVERFHRTMDEELAARGMALRQADIAAARAAYAPLVHIYNWERPHEALEMRVPGAVYEPSNRVRPLRLPEHELPEGAVKRRVSIEGKVDYRGMAYRVGKGLRGQTVEMREVQREGQDCAEILFAGVVVKTIQLALKQVKKLEKCKGCPVSNC
jgi:transposase InsO family protein